MGVVWWAGSPRISRYVLDEGEPWWDEGEDASDAYADGGEGEGGDEWVPTFGPEKRERDGAVGGEIQRFARDFDVRSDAR